MRFFSTRTKSITDDILDLAVFGMVVGAIINVLTWIASIGLLFWAVARWKGII